METCHNKMFHASALDKMGSRDKKSPRTAVSSNTNHRAIWHVNSDNIKEKRNSMRLCNVQWSKNEIAVFQDAYLISVFKLLLWCVAAEAAATLVLWGLYFALFHGGFISVDKHFTLRALRPYTNFMDGSQGTSWFLQPYIQTMAGFQNRTYSTWFCAHRLSKEAKESVNQNKTWVKINLTCFHPRMGVEMSWAWSSVVMKMS